MVAEYFIIWEGLALEGNKFLWTCGVWTAAELRNDSFCFVFVLSLSPQASCPRMLSYKRLRNKQICQQYPLSCDPKFSIKMRLCTCVSRITAFLFISCEIFTMIFVVSSVRLTFYLVSVMVWKWSSSWNTEGGTQHAAQQRWQRWSCNLHPTDEVRLSSSLEHIKN